MFLRILIQRRSRGPELLLKPWRTSSSTDSFYGSLATSAFVAPTGPGRYPELAAGSPPVSLQMEVHYPYIGMVAVRDVACYLQELMDRYLWIDRGTPRASSPTGSL